jgi:Cu/Ag efflux pump CusA
MQPTLEGRDGFGPAVVRAVACERFGPTVTTVIALVLVFLPMVVTGGAGLEVVQPMAIVVLGGIISSAVVALFVVPALYLHFGSRPQDAREEFEMFRELSETGAARTSTLIDA